MDLSAREKRALYLGTFTTLLPGLVVSGFMPELNVLPTIGWLLIAMVGAGIAGAVATPRPRWIRGVIAGAIAGGGAILGILLYVEIRSLLIRTATFLHLELAIGFLLGAAPGLLLFHRWARKR